MPKKFSIIALSRQFRFLDILWFITLSFNKYWYCFIWYWQPWSECNIKLVLFGIFLNAFLSIITTLLNTGLSVSSSLVISWLNQLQAINTIFSRQIKHGYIGCPFLIWCGCFKFSLKYIRCNFSLFPLYDLYLLTLIRLFNPNNFINIKKGFMVDTSSFTIEFIINSSVSVTTFRFVINGFYQLFYYLIFIGWFCLFLMIIKITPCHIGLI